MASRSLALDFKEEILLALRSRSGSAARSSGRRRSCCAPANRRARNCRWSWPRRKRGRRRQAAQRGIRGKAATGQGYGDPEKVCTQQRGPTEEEENKRRNGEMRACIITTRTASLQTQWHEERGVKKETARQLLARRSTPPIAKRSLARTHWSRSTRIKQTWLTEITNQVSLICAAAWTQIATDLRSQTVAAESA